MTIVHRFTSPAWLAALKSHIAAISSSGEASKRGAQDISNQIVELDAGEALVFAPSAILEVGDEGENSNGSRRMLKLGTRYMKVRVRQRTTADGGRSILAI